MYWLTNEAPDNVIAGFWYTIHMFRMPLFFLIAGLFGRMTLERLGTTGFIQDRSRRILVPLVAGIPIFMLLTGLAAMLGGLVAGVDIHGLRPPPGPPHQSVLAGLNLMHLWFLYYLILFYGAALLVRAASATLFGRYGRLPAAVDATLRFLVRSGCGPFVLALPAAAYFCQLKYWSPWGGFPAPFSTIPDIGALIAYGSFFQFGWLMHRQQQQLLALLEKCWPLYGVLALAAWTVCRMLAGVTPHWGPFLNGFSLIAYTGSYSIGGWCCSFGLIGLSVRFLSDYSPVRRYLADASYWIYLAHISVLIFLSQIVHPRHWNSGVKYLLSLAAAMAILLLSYHYLVRFTFIGTLLNGRRRRNQCTTAARISAPHEACPGASLSAAQASMARISPAGESTRREVRSRMLRTSFAVRCGRSASIRATMPETSAAASELPEAKS
jgi:membrane-bound acyltransferase YfiQ involved in biofilm formation